MLFHSPSDNLSLSARVWAVCAPSLLSGIVCSLLSIALVATIVVSDHYRGSVVQQYVAEWNRGAQLQTFGDPFHAADINDAVHTVVDTAFTFIFWSLLGLLAYTLAMSIIALVADLRRLRKELGYVHADRQQILRHSLQQFVTRLAATAALGVLLYWFFGQLIGLSIRWLNPSGGHGSPLPAVILGLVLLHAVIFHGMTICLRLIALRLRLLGQPA